MLFNLDNVVSIGKKQRNQNFQEKADISTAMRPILDQEIAFISFDFKDQNVNTYIAGWMSFKMSKYVCSACKSLISKVRDKSDSQHYFLNCKQYEHPAEDK